LGKTYIKHKLPPFVPIEKALIDSKAWECLSNASRVAYIHLKREICSPNPGEIQLSYQKMEKIMNRHTFARAIRQLEAVGFIIREQRGGLYRKRNVFRVSEEWKRYGTKGN
jgi:hypothetical protein